MKTFWIIFKRINKSILVITVLNIFWIYCYQLWWLNIPANNEFWFITGQIYSAIAYSFVAGYVIFFITSEYPKIKSEIEFNPVLETYIDKLNNTKQQFLFLLSYPDNDIERIDNLSREELHIEFKQILADKIKNEINETDKSYDDVVEEWIKKFKNILENLSSDSYKHFKYSHKYLTLDMINILRQIDIHSDTIFNTTHDIISFSEALGFGRITEKHGFMALELAHIYIYLNRLIDQLNEEVS